MSVTSRPCDQFKLHNHISTLSPRALAKNAQFCMKIAFRASSLDSLMDFVICDFSYVVKQCDISLARTRYLKNSKQEFVLLLLGGQLYFACPSVRSCGPYVTLIRYTKRLTRIYNRCFGYKTS